MPTHKIVFRFDMDNPLLANAPRHFEFWQERCATPLLAEGHRSHRSADLCQLHTSIWSDPAAGQLQWACS